MDKHGNVIAEEGCTRCECGCKYWENDVCVSCGEPYRICFLCHRDESYCQQMCSVFPPESCGGNGDCPLCTTD